MSARDVDDSATWIATCPRCEERPMPCEPCRRDLARPRTTGSRGLMQFLSWRKPAEGELDKGS